MATPCLKYEQCMNSAISVAGQYLASVGTSSILNRKEHSYTDFIEKDPKQPTQNVLNVIVTIFINEC
jgi:hypothetical protein